MNNWNFAIIGGYSSNYSNLGLLGEKKLTSNTAIITEVDIRFQNDTLETDSFELRSYFIKYLKDSAFLFEGLYCHGSLGIKKYFTIYDELDINANVSIGYGWHFFKDSLLLSLEGGLQYMYGFWDFPNPQEGSMFVFPYGMRISYIF